MPIATWEQFKNNPDVQKIVVARLRPWKHPTGWSAHLSGSFRAAADHDYEAVEEFDTLSGAVGVYTRRESAAQVDANPGSWTIEDGALVIRPLGASGLASKRIRARWTLAADTHGRLFDQRFHEPVILALPELTHQFAVLDSTPAKSDGRLVLADDPERSIDMARLLTGEVLLNAESDLYLGGEALPFPEYRHFHAGVVRGWEWDGQGGSAAIWLDDRRRHLQRKIAIPPGGSATFAGRADQIYAQLLGALGLSAAGIPDLAAERPWTLRITLTEDTRAEDVLELVDRSALTYHLVDRSGKIVLKPWKEPDPADPALRAYDEATECRNLRIVPAADRLFTRVKVTFASGARGTRQKAPERSEARHARNAAGPWALHGTASNLWGTAWDVEPDEVTMDGAPIPREASMADANTNDRSWFYHDRERRLYVNPALQGAADDHDWRVYWRQEKSLGAPSGAGLADENLAVAVDARAEWKYGLVREWRIDSVIDNAVHAQAMAAAALALAARPRLEIAFEAALKPLDSELGDTIRVDFSRPSLGGLDPHFRIRSLQEDYAANRIRLRAWRLHDFEP